MMNSAFMAGLGFFRKKPISSRTPGRNWKKVEESGFFHFIPEESGRNWNKVKDITKINVYNTVLLMFDIDSASNR